ELCDDAGVDHVLDDGEPVALHPFEVTRELRGWVECHGASFLQGYIWRSSMRESSTRIDVARARFWAYPREPHGFQEPAHSQHLLDTWAAFFDEQLAAK